MPVENREMSVLCPVTENLSDRLLRLPFYNTLTIDEQERVINTILEYNF